MQNDLQKLVSEMEAHVAEFGGSVSTLGERAGQGGRFYARLKEGKRAWPETVASVRAFMAAERKRLMNNPAAESGTVASPVSNTPGAA